MTVLQPSLFHPAHLPAFTPLPGGRHQAFLVGPPSLRWGPCRPFSGLPWTVGTPGPSLLSHPSQLSPGSCRPSLWAPWMCSVSSLGGGSQGRQAEHMGARGDLGAWGKQACSPVTSCWSRLPQGPGALSHSRHSPLAAPAHIPQILSPVRQGGYAPSLVPPGRCFGPAVE